MKKNKEENINNNISNNKENQENIRNNNTKWNVFVEMVPLV